MPTDDQKITHDNEVSEWAGRFYRVVYGPTPLFGSIDLKNIKTGYQVYVTSDGQRGIYWAQTGDPAATAAYYTAKLSANAFKGKNKGIIGTEDIEYFSYKSGGTVTPEDRLQMLSVFYGKDKAAYLLADADLPLIPSMTPTEAWEKSISVFSDAVLPSHAPAGTILPTENNLRRVFIPYEEGSGFKVENGQYIREPIPNFIINPIQRGISTNAITNLLEDNIGKDQHPWFQRLCHGDEQADMFVGVLFTTLSPENGHISWCLKEYDPNDKEEFPLPLQFKQAGRIFVPQNPGRVLEVHNGDNLVVFMDYAYRHPLLRGTVQLDYEVGKVLAPWNQNEKVQMMGKSPVNGIPTNIPVEKWCEFFFEGRPAVLFRRKGEAVKALG